MIATRMWRKEATANVSERLRDAELASPAGLVRSWDTHDGARSFSDNDKKIRYMHSMIKAPCIGKC